MTARAAVLVAPLDPEVAPPHLGAAKKIELVAGLLARLGFDVHLVDSSHTVEAWRRPVLGQRREFSSTRVTYWRPACTPWRKLGKTLNVLAPGALPTRLAELRPKVVWLYNAYAFESRLGLHLKRVTGCELVLELEDLPRARGRGLNPKPLLDAWYFERLLPRADLVTFVNAALATRFAPRLHGRAMLFPSLLGSELTATSTPVRFQHERRQLGYFGSLEREKGAGVVLELVSRLPDAWHVVVTGAGSLEQEFVRTAAAHPRRLTFHGRVERQRLAELMLESDAIVNPHASISAMDDGVFPFKVCEALASGALVISTPLPPIDVDIAAAVVPFDGSAAGLALALSAAPRLYAGNQPSIDAVRRAVAGRYSEDGVLCTLRGLLAGASGSHAAA
jgi:glycosyltransferase involved in cell wall biosynthesis